MARTDAIWGAVAACACLVLAACGSGTQPVGLPVTPSVEGLPAVSNEYAVLPDDGWYLSIFVYDSDEATRLAEATVYLEQARASGYPDAAILPFPGPGNLCLGRECPGTGPAPSEGTLIVLSGLEGPDFTSAATSDAELISWRETVAEPFEVAAHEAGFSGLSEATVTWQAFSDLRPAEQLPAEDFLGAPGT